MVHHERVHWPGWLVLIAVLMALLLAGSSIGMVRGLAAEPDRPTHLLQVLGIVLLVVMATICWRFRFLEISFGQEGIGYGFGRIRKRIASEQILAVEAVAYDWVRYMGWGWRIGPTPGERAYSILGCPRGVRVAFRRADGSQVSLFLSAEDPDAAIRALALTRGSLPPAAIEGHGPP